MSALLVALGCSSEASQSPLPPVEVAVTPVGAARGDAVQKDVSPGGGTLTSADGRLTVEVPAGALTTPQTLSIQAISNEAPGGVGAAFRLGPEGTTFAKPVTLTFHYTASDLAGSDQAGLQIGYQDSKHQWNALKKATRDDAGNKLSVVTTHFSDWALLEGYQLRPPAAIVKPGQPLALEFLVCSNRVAGTDELVELRNVCRPDDALIAVNQWSANGVVNGDPSVGTLGGATGTSAVFTAPAIAPVNNPVAVAAEATDQTTKRKILLIANVFVAEHPPMSGTISTKQKDNHLGLVMTSKTDVRLVWDNDQQFYVVDKSSVVTAHWDIVATMCETHGTFMKNLKANEGSVVVLDVGYFPMGATTGTFVGTSACGGQVPEPFMLDREIEWWPSPMDALYEVKPDGSFDDGYVDQLLGSGMTLSADWKLSPQLK